MGFMCFVAVIMIVTTAILNKYYDEPQYKKRTLCTCHSC